MTYTDRLNGTVHSTPLISQGRTDHIVNSGIHYLKTLGSFNLQADFITDVLRGTHAASALRHDIAALTTGATYMDGLEEHINRAPKKHAARESILRLLHQDIPEKYTRLANAYAELDRLNSIGALSAEQASTTAQRLGYMEEHLNKSAAHIPALTGPKP